MDRKTEVEVSGLRLHVKQRPPVHPTVLFQGQWKRGIFYGEVSLDEVSAAGLRKARTSLTVQ